METDLDGRSWYAKTTPVILIQAAELILAPPTAEGCGVVHCRHVSTPHLKAIDSAQVFSFLLMGQPCPSVATTDVASRQRRQPQAGAEGLRTQPPWVWGLSRRDQ